MLTGGVEMEKAALYQRRKSIKALDEDLISSGALILTGSHDRYRHPIAIFPVAADDFLATRFTAAHVVILIRYYYSICYHGNETRGMAFVVNLHRWKRETIKVLVDALDMAQDDHRGTIGVLYAVQPRTKDLQKHFKKLTGLRASKRNPKIPRYETVCVSVPSELLRFMEVKHLTDDFGGSLSYNHQAWISFMKTMDELEESINRTLDKLPEAHDKLSLMCDYEVPDTQTEAELLLSQIRSKYHGVMRDLNLEHMIDECQEVIRTMTAPHILPQYTQIMNTPSFCEARRNLEQYERQLVRSRGELKDIWQTAEGRIISLGRVVKHRNKAVQILEWVRDVGFPAVRERAEIADCLSKAEILRTQYETGFLSVAKNVLWLAGKTQKKLDVAVLENKSSLGDLPDLSKQLKATTEQFRKLTQTKYQVYGNVYDFFLVAHKVAKWYRHTLRFLPVQLLRQQPVMLGGFHDVVYHGNPAWFSAIANYVQRHPVPKLDQVTRLKNIIPVIDEINIRNQARLLVHRVGILILLLRDPSKLKLPDMQALLRWRSQVLEGLDDITLNLNSSTLDLTDLGAVPGENLTERPRSASGHRSAPKLRSVPILAGGLAGTGEADTGLYYSLDRGVHHYEATNRRQSVPVNVYHQPEDVPPLDLSFVDQESVSGSEHLVYTDTRRGRSSGERYVSLGYLDDSGLPSSVQVHSNSPHSVGRSGREPRDRPVPHTAQVPPSYPSTHHIHHSLPDLNTNSPAPVSMDTPPSLTMDTVVNSNLSAEEKLDLMSRICLGESCELTPELYYKLYPDPHVTKPQQSRKSDLHPTTLPRSHKVRDSGVSQGEIQLPQQQTRPKSAVNINMGSQGHPGHHVSQPRSIIKQPRSRPLLAQEERSLAYTPMETASLLYNQPESSTTRDTGRQSYNRDSGYSEMSQLQRQSADYLHLNMGHHRSEPHLVAPQAQPQPAGDSSRKESQAVPSGRRKPSKRASIKVEEWMQRPEHQLQMTRGHDPRGSKVTDPDYAREENAGLTSSESYRSLSLVRSSYPINAASSLADSDTDGLESVLADRRLAELALEEAELDQEDLELSLQKTERILQEQEALLKEFDLHLPASPTSTTSSGSPTSAASSVTLLEETIHATHVEDQLCPLVPAADTSGGDREALREGSLSEESGVYTQSTDSRLRSYPDHMHTGSSLSLNRLATPHHLHTPPSGQPHTSHAQGSSPCIRLQTHEYGVTSSDELENYCHAHTVETPGGVLDSDSLLHINGHLSVTKESSLGDSSSQATVMTEIHRNQSLSSASSRSNGEDVVEAGGSAERGTDTAIGGDTQSSTDLHHDVTEPGKVHPE